MSAILLSSSALARAIKPRKPFYHSVLVLELLKTTLEKILKDMHEMMMEIEDFLRPKVRVLTVISINQLYCLKLLSVSSILYLKFSSVLPTKLQMLLFKS